MTQMIPISFSATPDDVQSVRDAADAHGMSMSAYLRMILFETKARKSKAADFDLTAMLNDIRKRGWRVAVHNDYQQDGHVYTFYLFTLGRWNAKGEGRTDEEAILAALDTMDRIESMLPFP